MRGIFFFLISFFIVKSSLLSEDLSPLKVLEHRNYKWYENMRFQLTHIVENVNHLDLLYVDKWYGVGINFSFYRNKIQSIISYFGAMYGNKDVFTKTNNSQIVTYYDYKFGYSVVDLFLGDNVYFPYDTYAIGNTIRLPYIRNVLLTQTINRSFQRNNASSFYFKNGLQFYFKHILLECSHFMNIAYPNDVYSNQYFIKIVIGKFWERWIDISYYFGESRWWGINDIVGYDVDEITCSLNLLKTLQYSLLFQSKIVLKEDIINKNEHKEFVSEVVFERYLTKDVGVSCRLVYGKNYFNATEISNKYGIHLGLFVIKV